MIELINVSKSFINHQRTIQAIDNISLSIDQSEIFGLVGQSGTGKSTLLRFINALSKQDEGEVLIEGQSIQQMSAHELRELRKNISMVFQRFNLLHNLTVRENILLPLKLHRYDHQLAIDDVLSLVGLTDYQFQYPSQLSGGQQQRVGIARALITQPKIMLLDEPTSALDEYTMNELIDVLKTIHREFDMTMIVVTHQLSLAQRLCHRIGVMESGRLLDVLNIVKQEEGIKQTSYTQYVREVLGYE